jgi:hypothetical protein
MISLLALPASGQWAVAPLGDDPPKGLSEYWSRYVLAVDADQDGDLDVLNAYFSDFQVRENLVGVNFGLPVESLAGTRDAGPGPPSARSSCRWPWRSSRNGGGVTRRLERSS